MTTLEAVLLLLTAGVWSMAMISAAVCGPSILEGWQAYRAARTARKVKALKEAERREFNRLLGR